MTATLSSVRMRVLALLIALTSCARPARCPTSTPVQTPADTPALAAIGETWTLESRTLGERRVVNVYVPPGYATSSDRYPVLYMADGGLGEDFPHVVGSVDVSIKNGVIRPVIVVGVENTERRRDLVGPTTVPAEVEAAPNAGGNERFRAFLRDELVPTIEARYRTTDESAMIGESLAGLFVVETFLLEPTLFDAYIAADPSLFWNQQALVSQAAARLADWTAGAKVLYVATSDEADAAATGLLLDALTDAAVPGIAWTHEPMPHEHHATIFPTAALHGIRLVFAPR
jgi:predicted alpha/beta superfamily hydrolase